MKNILILRLFVCLKIYTKLRKVEYKNYISKQERAI